MELYLLPTNIFDMFLKSPSAFVFLSNYLIVGSISEDKFFASKGYKVRTQDTCTAVGH
jgi:hypothetical protein